MKGQKIALLGAGNISRAIVSGLLADGYSAGDIIACDPEHRQLLELKKMGVATSTSNQEGVIGADTIVICVKPNLVKVVCDDMASSLKENQLVMSVAAGITTSSLLDWLGPDACVVRCMPNTPALVRQGMTVLYPTQGIKADQKIAAEEIASAIGASLWIEDEGLMDVVTAISGSGPAYFFLVMEALEKAGVRLGLDQLVVQQLVNQTALGAAQMVMQGTDSAQQLRQKVTSPAGTTEAAVGKLLENNILEAFDAAVDAACKRSIEMSKN